MENNITLGEFLAQILIFWINTEMNQHKWRPSELVPWGCDTFQVTAAPLHPPGLSRHRAHLEPRPLSAACALRSVFRRLLRSQRNCALTEQGWRQACLRRNTGYVLTFWEMLNLQLLQGFPRAIFLFLPDSWTLESDSCKFKFIAYPSVLVRLSDQVNLNNFS